MGDSDRTRQLPGALGNANRLKLGTFATNLGRGGTVSTASGLLPPRWPAVRQAAQLADDMGLEMLVPVARWRGFGGETNYGQASFETLTWAAGLAAQTRQIFVFATCHVPVIHPILAAKQIVTIDHISGGRCGLNIVGGWHRPEIEMFGYELVEHDSRYDMADEWAAIVRNLWTSTEEFDFDGRYFQLRGACCEPKPLQDPHPPIMNAGGSARGQRFAAENASIVFLFIRDPGNFGEMQKSVTSYRDLAREKGNSLSVWTSATVICRPTAQAAHDHADYLLHEKGDQVAVGNMLTTLGIESAVLGDKAQQVTDRFLAGWGSVLLVGTPLQIAAGLGMISDAGYDGCLLVFPEWDTGLATFRDEVLPLLQQQGLRETSVGLSR
jgi:alkanesulfonate monooxygenase SsuD/methylene tetrahydromethanopterin reductase-like flavin-dependent oxidoreductase (luciferase family)